MTVKKPKMPVLTIIVFFFLLFSLIGTFGGRTYSFVLNVVNVTQFGGGIPSFQIILPYLLSTFSYLGLIAATVLAIVSLFRRRAGKLLLVSLIFALGSLFVSLISSPLTILLFGYRPTLSSFSETLGVLLSLGAALLTALLVLGALFPKSKALTFGPLYLFFLPFVLECVASLCKIGSILSYAVEYLKVLFDAGIEITPVILISLCNSLSPVPLYFWSTIAFLLLGIFIRKAVKAAIPDAPALQNEPAAQTEAAQDEVAETTDSE